MKFLSLTKDVIQNEEIIKALDYEVESVKKSFIKGYSIISYHSHDNVSNKVQSLRREYMPKQIIPFFVSVILIALAFITATTYLVLNFALKDNFDTLSLFFMMMVPAFILLIIAVGLSFYRYQATMKNLNSYAALAYIKSEVKK